MAMTEHEILKGFAETIEEFAGVPAAEVVLSANLVDDLEIDSLSMVEIVVSVQDKFSIEVPDKDLKDLKTVQDIVTYIQSAQLQRASAAVGGE